MTKKPSAIVVEGGARIEIKNGTFSGFDTVISSDGAVTLDNTTIRNSNTGIQIDGGSLDARNLTFDGVGTPFNAQNLSSGRLTGGRVQSDPKSKGAHSGWTRPKGAPLPIFCPSCNEVHASRNYVFGGQFYNLWNNLDTCPKCGSEKAQLSEGTFKLLEEAAEIISAPAMTHAMFQAMIAISRSLDSGEITTEEAIQKVAEVNEPLADFVKKWGPLGTLASPIIAAIVGACVVYLTYTNNERQHVRQLSQYQVMERMLNTLDTIDKRQEQRNRQQADGEPAHTGNEAETECKSEGQIAGSRKHDSFSLGHKNPHQSKRQKRRQRAKQK